MSRTIRRKNTKQGLPFYVDRYYNIPDHYWYWGSSFSEKEWKLENILYHSDKWESNAPKSFRQPMNRIFRSKNKAILDRAIRDNNDEPMFIPFTKDANWNYW
jgi:hypothetical protein